MSSHGMRMRICLDEEPDEPFAAAVILPFASTVILAEVYEPGVTAVFARVVAKLPVPLPVTSHVSVIVWSPVFVPEVLASFETSSYVRERKNIGLMEVPEILIKETTPGCTMCCREPKLSYTYTGTTEELTAMTSQFPVNVQSRRRFAGIPNSSENPIT